MRRKSRRPARSAKRPTSAPGSRTDGWGPTPAWRRPRRAASWWRWPRRGWPRTWRRSEGMRRRGAHRWSGELRGQDLTRANRNRPRRQGLAGDAKTALRAKECAVRAAQDEVALASQVTVADRGQRRAGVRAAVDVAEHVVAAARDESVEQVVARAEVEAAGAGIGEVAQAA